MDTTTETVTDVKTFRGRSLDEVLPQIRAELGADAIVVRRREGLAGGVAGFFQRSYVEVDARSAHDDEKSLEARNDRATAEGFESPAIRALVDQAAPFADALAQAQSPVGARAHEVLIAAAQGAARDLADAPAAEPVSAGLYGPQPNRAAIEDAAPVYEPVSVPAEMIPPAVHEMPAPEPRLPSREGLGAERPNVADAHEQRLVAAGLSAAFAKDIVAEAVAHGLPFADARNIKKLIRTTLSRRMPIMADLGGEARTIAFVGAGGAGKTSATERLATAYAKADADVVVVALRAGDGGVGLASRLEPLGVSVIAADNAEQAARRIARREATLTIVDAPAAGPADRAAVARIAEDLKTLGVNEVHLTLPATLSAAAADELASALAPLGVTHIALTHADQTTRPGAPVELAVTGRRALSYVCSRAAIEPVDPDALAKQLLP
jgi:flagellar biosynthesis protein FlhF